MRHTVEIAKVSQRRLNHDKLKMQVDKIISRALGSNRAAKGWSCVIENAKDWHSPKHREDEYKYICKLSFVCAPKKERPPEAIKQDFANILNVVSAAGNIPGWQVAFVDGKLADEKKDERLAKNIVGYVPVELPNDWRTHFLHIYEREQQIDIIVSAILAGINSNFHDRFHCALVGPPSCGKTATLAGVKAALGADAVMEYDATSTTQAGAIKDLDSRENLPRILIVEEIEKADENSLRWLLSVMDHRAEIRKTNYRGNIQKETRLLTLATVNDYKLFKKIMYGALASRFAYHLMFPKPNRALLQKILEREVARIKGDKRWIKPTLDFAEAQNIHDPRKVTAICLCGREQLLDKSYQAKLMSCTVTNYDQED